MCVSNYSCLLVNVSWTSNAILTFASANAIKFTEDGEVELVVQSCEALTADRLLLIFSVRDTGIGISPSQVGELFSLFTQLDSSSTRRYEGSGLGTIASLLLRFFLQTCWCH